MAALTGARPGRLIEVSTFLRIFAVILSSQLVRSSWRHAAVSAWTKTGVQRTAQALTSPLLPG